MINECCGAESSGRAVTTSTQSDTMATKKSLANMSKIKVEVTNRYIVELYPCFRVSSNHDIPRSSAAG